MALTDITFDALSTSAPPPGEALRHVDLSGDYLYELPSAPLNLATAKIAGPSVRHMSSSWLSASEWVDLRGCPDLKIDFNKSNDTFLVRSVDACARHARSQCFLGPTLQKEKVDSRRFVQGNASWDARAR